MPATIKFMVNEKGAKTSAIVPIKTWEQLNVNYNKLQLKINTLLGLKSALLEVKEAKKSNKKLQSLKSFLDESSN